MNRFVAFAILALASLVAANSVPTGDDIVDEQQTQGILDTEDSVETRQVVDNGLSVFADFCIQSRDYVLADVKQKSGTASSQGFSWFFAMTEEITVRAMEVNKNAANRLSNQLANPQAEVEGDDEVAAAQREVQGQSQPRALLTAIQAALATTANAVVEVASEKIARAKEMIDANNFARFAQYACGEIDKYETELRGQFEEYKKNSLTSDAREQFSLVEFEHVPCFTVNRISRANGICRFVNVAIDPLKKIYATVRVSNNAAAQTN